LFNSIQIRLTLIFTFIILIAAGALCTFLIITHHEQSLEEAAYNLNKQADLVADLAAPAILEGGSDPDILAKKLGVQIDALVTIIAPDGTVLGDSVQSPAIMENFTARPEVREALEKGLGKSIRYSIRYSTVEKSKNMYVAVSIHGKEGILGIARVSLPLYTIEKNINNQVSLIIYAVFAVCLFLIIITWLVSRTISVPLRKLLFAANSVASGNLGQQAAINSKDEVGRLSTAFNSMSLKLKANEEKLIKQFEEMESLSIRDSLTGLYNRRGFFLLGEQQMKQAQRLSGNLYLLYIDLNDFKSINDRFGHETGDQALVKTAAFLNGNTRKSDIIARLGGDEFVILMLNAVESSQQAVIERIIANLKEFNVKERLDYQIKMSIGVSNYDADMHRSLDDLLSAADTTMYGKKKIIKASESYYPPEKTG
jgi:diguanylate cyclase (GGDEF)-like protein